MSVFLESRDVSDGNEGSQVNREASKDDWELLAKTILLICPKLPTGQRNIKRQRNSTQNTFFLSFLFSFFFFFPRNIKLLTNFYNILVESFFFEFL